MMGDGRAESPLSELAFLTGLWTVEGQAFPSVYGAAGRFGGDVVATWGPRKAWIRLEQASNMGAVGSYAVVALVFFDPGPGRLRCYSVDESGSGRSYGGRVVRPGEAVFTSEPSPADATIQRLTYAEIDAGRVRYLVELADDGGSGFRGYSEAVWTPDVAR